MTDPSSGNPDQSFSLYVTYSQVAVFLHGMRNPFNDWLPIHVDQGFSWRKGSVSFMTLVETGELRIRFEHSTAPKIRDDARGAIQVPFHVPVNERIEIATISEGRVINVPPGSYALLYQTGVDSAGAMWCIFSFGPSEGPSPTIIKADARLDPPAKLFMHAEPAS